MIASVLAWLYPDRCALCSAVGEPAVCQQCLDEMKLAGPVRWDPPPLDFRAGVYVYEKRASQAVRRLKYARSTALSSFMAEALAPRIAQLAEPHDVVVPVPIHWRRRGDRGFNQAEILCSGEHGRSVLSAALRRVRFTPPQASLPVAARGENLRDAFVADKTLVSGRKILLVDDVLTTGYTARACAQTLLDAGATGVGIVAFAIVP